MSGDLTPPDHVKAHFARKSSAQLQEIVQAGPQARWSPQAILAAGEILRERSTGRAQDPAAAEEEYRLRAPTIPYSLGFIVGFLPVFAMNGFRFGSEFEASEADADLPVPFGPRIAWLAVDATDTEAVGTALGVRDAQAATWADGMDAAYQAEVFVTPPLGQWTLAVGAALFPPDRPESFVKPLLERLSEQFGDAQYFCTYRDAELHIWARARNGRLIRGYGWLGSKGQTLWDERVPTKQELALGLRFVDGRSPEGATPDENGVMQLAALWSLDPTSLSEEFKEPVMGLRGTAAWTESRISR
jgi:hypothetical protein